MLEGLALAPVVSALIALLGVLFGLGIARFVLPHARKIKRLEAEMDQMRRTHEEYRGRVSTHFHKTAELIGHMTASYKAVYDHLSDGAQTLCSGDALSGPAAFSGPRLIFEENVEVTPGGVRSEASVLEAGPQVGTASSASARLEETTARRAESVGACEGVSKASGSSGPGETSKAAASSPEDASAASGAHASSTGANQESTEPAPSNSATV